MVDRGGAGVGVGLGQVLGPSQRRDYIASELERETKTWLMIEFIVRCSHRFGLLVG